MQRGEIRWASLPRPRGSEPGLKRPVLVIQSDAFNASKIQTAVVVAITSNLRLARAPGNVQLSKRTSGLPRDSVVNVSQLLTLDRVHLSKPISQLTRRSMERVEEGIRLVLGL